MPAVPLNVSGNPGPDFFTITWTRPPDATIIGFQVSYGFKSGVYTNVIDVGNVTSYTISPLPFDENVYVIVQSFDGATPPNLSPSSVEITRLFPITPPMVLVAVPDALAPTGGVNDLFWVNPIDPNLKGQIVTRAKEGKSVSGMVPATVVGAGQTVTFAFNAQEVQTVVLAANVTGATIAADIQAKVRAATPVQGAEYLPLYASFAAQFFGGQYVLSVATCDGVPYFGNQQFFFQGVGFFPAESATSDKFGNFMAQWSNVAVAGNVSATTLSATLTSTSGPPTTGSLAATFDTASGRYLGTWTYGINSGAMQVEPGTGRNKVVVTGGTAAPALKLGVANGGTEFLGTGAITIVTSLAPLSKYQDVVNLNSVRWAYGIQSSDFSNPPQVSRPAIQATVTSAVLLGSSPPSAPKNLAGDDNAVSIQLFWDANPESNIASYEVHWATSLAALSGSPNIVNVGLGTTYVLSGFLPTDDVYVEVFAIDNGVNPDMTSRPPFKSGPSNVFSRIISEGGITTAFVLQTDLSNNTTLVWNNIPTADHFDIEIDGVPTFNSANLVTLERFIKVEDLVYLSQPYSFPQQRSTQVTWYWRVRPVYPGSITGLWNTQVRADITLNGIKAETLGVGAANLPPAAEFLGSSLVVKSGATTYVQDTDYKFIAPNQIARIQGGAIADGQTVEVIAEFVQSLTIGVNRQAETRDKLQNALDPLYYDVASRTTNIFKWFEAISRGAMADYVIANRVLIQGSIINTTVPSELYERYGGMVTLTTNEIPIPDAYAAVKALYPAFLNAGTIESIQLACLGLTGRECTIKQSGTGAGSGWILHGDDGPPSGLPDFVFSDFPGFSLPVDTFTMVLADFDDVFNWNITVNNAARGVEKSVVRDDRVGLTDFLGVTNIVPGSLRLIDSLMDTVDPGRYTVDYTNGTVTWNSELSALPPNSIYTAICGVFIIDLIKRILNELLPAHVNPIYTFQVQNLAQVLGLMVWEVSFWDSSNWAG